MPALAGYRAAEQVEIKPIADDLVGRREQRARLRRPPRRVAGAGADDRKPAARAADRAGIERRGGASDRAGGAARLAAGNDKHAVRSDSGKRRALGHPPAAGRAKRRLRADRQPLGFGEQPRRRKEPGRDAERARKIMDRRLVGLEVDRNDRGDRTRREPGLGERVVRQRGDFLGRDAALAADAERQDRRMEDERVLVRRCGSRSVTMILRSRRPSAPSQTVPARSQSARAASSTSITGSPASSAAAIGLTRSGLAMRQPGGGSSSAKPRRRSPAVVIAAVPPIAAASARASALAPRCPPSSGTATDPSSASATTGGSALFAREQRRQRPDQDTAGAQPDNRPPGREQLAQQRDQPIVCVSRIARLGARDEQLGSPAACRGRGARARPRPVPARQSRRRAALSL